MWDFLKFIIPTLFVISFILLKTIPKDNEIYSGIKKFFKFSVLLFRIFISMYIFIFIIDIVFSIFISSILEGVREFLLGFG
ncbi:MAG: hypothetical protein NC040_02520, partial [Muribaculaceae bacterium]|nr:hypothetical protein [Muribaculaceae bacterium]